MSVTHITSKQYPKARKRRLPDELSCPIKMAALGDNVDEGEGDWIAGGSINSSRVAALLAARSAAASKVLSPILQPIKGQHENQVQQRLIMRQPGTSNKQNMPLSAANKSHLLALPPTPSESRGSSSAKHRACSTVSSKTEFKATNEDQEEKEEVPTGNGQVSTHRGCHLRENQQQDTRVLRRRRAKARPPSKWRAEQHIVERVFDATHKLNQGNQRLLVRLRDRSWPAGTVGSSISMWPSWRKIVILSFLSVLMASLLANLNILSQGASTSCLLFNHCHALSVRQTSVGGGASNSSEPPSLVGAHSGAQQLGGSSQRPRLSAILVPSSTTVSTASMSAPTSSPVSTQSSLAIQVAERSNRSQSSNQESASQLRYHQQLTQLANPTNRTAAKVANSQRADNRDDEDDDHQRVSQLESARHTGNNNGPVNKFQPFDNNYQADNGKQRPTDGVDNNNKHAGSQRAAGSSITRTADSPPSVRLNGEKESASSPTLNKNHLKQHHHHHQQHLAANSVPIQSSRGSVRLMGSQGLVELASQASQTLSLAGAGKFERNQHQNQLGFRPIGNPKEFPLLTEGWSVVQQHSAPTSSAGNQSSAGSANYFAHKADQVADQAQLINSMMSPQMNSQSQPALAGTSSLVGQPKQQQFLVSAGLAIPPSLLQSLVKNALTDLVANTAAGEQILGAASHAQPLVLKGPLSSLNPLLNFHSDQSDGQQLALQLNSDNKQSPKTSASASAPSISLPPLSHFLVPRNPFRLFSSSSTPIATRYRPSFMAKSASKLVGKSNKLSSGANRWTGLGSQPSIDMSASIQNQLRTPSYQGTASLFGLDDVLSSAADPAGSTGSLYAHSHSAEQLERLVRAASQASGVHSPILPAIVSAPNGAFPGFYIPAVESESESQVNEFRHGAGNNEQNIISSKIPGTDYILHPDEVRAMINIGELAWRKQQTGTEGDHSKQNQVASSNRFFGAHPETPFNQHHQPGNQPDAGETRANWRFMESQQSPQHPFAFGNLMKENHAENARDFAYVDPQTRHDQFQAASQSSASRYPIQQPQPGHTLNRANVTVDLANQLSNHFKQNQVNSFPAIIRVNDQDYVHWPLIKFRQAAASNQQQHFRHPNDAEESRKLYSQLQPFQAAGLYQAKLTPYQRGHLFAIAAHPAQLGPNNVAPAFYSPATQNQANVENVPPNQHQANQEHQQPYQQHSFGGNPRPASGPLNQVAAAANQQVAVRVHSQPQPAATKGGPNLAGESVQQPSSGNQLHNSGGSPANTRNNLPNLEHSPVRLATQLTPQEVRQVEDSIIEALLMAQTLQQQRQLAQGMAINHRQSPDYNRQRALGNNNEPLEAAGNTRKSRFKSGFFSRRRRRNSHTLNNNAKRRPQTLSTASSEPIGNYVSTVPLLNVSSLSLQILPPTLLQFSHLDLVDPPPQAAPRLVKLPVVMADQETNKPNLDAASPVGSKLASADSIHAESSVPRVSLVRPADVDGQSTMAFGSRVPRLNSAASISSGVPTRAHFRAPSVDHQVTPLRALTEANRHLLTNAIIKHQQVDTEEAPKAQMIEIVPAGKQPARAGVNRINVDWPAMVSDADYFPDPNQQPRQHQKEARPQKKQSNSKAELDKQVARAQPVQVSAESRQVLDGGHFKRQLTRTSGPISLNNYVSSQLKLQFAQDYQAREGVPIYNNNVRVAGALDRARSPTLTDRGESRSSSQLRHQSIGASNQSYPRLDLIEPSMDDEDAEDADESSPDESARPNDLQSRGSQVGRQVAQAALSVAPSTGPISIRTSHVDDDRPAATKASEKRSSWRRESPPTDEASVGSTKKSDAH